MDEEAQPSTFCPWQPKETPVIDHADRTWWRQAVVFQIYVRSFFDGNGDGIGDIDGLRYRPPYLRDLGIDAIWLAL